ncbi:MAG: ADP-glyceromanno-heptose 6-epimerase [Puniceicoccales bacterium]|jgi:ADP-L-glycero-D-manno-heptose 6-epimerase|nr:ADP-glyceromanno-heptose 6-epimerase [Puniceicoccales bacterium]
MNRLDSRNLLLTRSFTMGLFESDTILVTGGAGFIGSALVCELNDRGYDNIIVADFLGNGDKFLNLVTLKFADYMEADALLELVRGNDPRLKKVTHIFHMGACSSTTERNAAYLIKNNYEYSKILANFANQRNIRFVYASSAATYGDGSNGMSDSDNSNFSLRPLNMYAYSKHLFDLYVARNCLRVYGIKYFNVFGPNEYHKGEMRSMVLKAYESIIATGKVNLFKSYNPSYKDGEQMRDFLWVRDAVAMTIFLAEIPEVVNGEPTNGVYNSGSGVASPWNALVSAVFKAMGLQPNIEYIEMPGALKCKYQHYTRGDISKLRKIGYSGKITPLEDAVGNYVKNYLMSGMKRLEPQNETKVLNAP